MEITCQRLKHILELTGPAIPKGKKRPLPILDNLLCKERYAVASNGEIAIAVELPELPEGEALLVPYASLKKSLQHVPGGALLSVSPTDAARWLVGDRTINITGAGLNLSLPAGDVQDFPDFPEFEEQMAIDVDGDRFVKETLALMPYAATEDSRPVLTGVCLFLSSFLEEPVVGVAADGFRLAWSHLGFVTEATEGQNREVIVPATTIKALAQIWKQVVKRPRPNNPVNLPRLTDTPQLSINSLAVAKRYIRLAMAEGRIKFGCGEAMLLSQRIQGEYPKYMSLIPAKGAHSVVFDAGSAERAVRQLAPVAAENNIIRLSWREGSVTFEAHNDEGGRAETSLVAVTQGEASRIAFNLRYLSQYLNGKEGRVLLETSGQSNPGRLTHAGTPNLVLMPMFVQWGDQPEAKPEEPVEEAESAEHE